MSKPQTKIYVVMGAQGDYEDATEWPVAAYLDKQMALAHAKAAENADGATRDQYRKRGVWTQARQKWLNALYPKWDPEPGYVEGLEFKRTYGVAELPLLEALPANPETAAEKAAEKMRDLLGIK